MKYSAFKPEGAMRVWILITLLTFLFVAGLGGSASLAAPGPHIAAPNASPQSVDWMSPDTAARLHLGFDVLVPADVPAPFEGEPDVTSRDGYYSLYWVVPGTPPTFLQITGEVGGTIPDYSKYDRNNQLQQNAEVAGHPAYHDLTPIYDLVYWQVDDVVYSVESRNLTEDDSLALAGALVPISPQNPDGSGGGAPDNGSSATLSLPDRVAAGETVSIGVEGVEGATMTADAGTFTETGGATYNGAGGAAVSWQAPAPESDTWVTFTVSDPESGEMLASGSTLVLAAAASEPPLTLSCPASAAAGTSMEFVLSGTGPAIVDAGDGLFPMDGPNGAFEAAGGAGRTIVGSVPDAGEITLVWTAPTVTEAGIVYLFATTELGETTGECAIEVVPFSSGDGSAAGGDSEVVAQSVPEDPQATDAEPAGGDANQSSSQGQQGQSVNQEQPTATAKPDDKTKPAEIRNEVRGLSTVIPATGDGGGEPAPGPSPTVRSSPTPRPTATIAPTISDDGMVAAIVGPEGGSLTSPGGVTVTLPPGALTEQVTLSIRPVSDTKLPVQEGVDLISASGFDVAIAAPNGRAIDRILQPAEIRVELGKERMKSGAKIYRVDGAQLVPLSNTRTEETTLVITVESFSRFVAGVPSTVSGTKNRSLLPFVLAAVVVILVMIAMIVLGGMFRPRRQRVVVTRRPPRSRYR